MIIIYTILAALLPPSFSAATLVWFMAIPAMCIGLGLVTLIWMFDSRVAEGVWTDTHANIVTLVVTGFAFLLFANFKVGTLGPLLGVAFFATVYTTQVALIQTSRMIRHGVLMHVDITHPTEIRRVIEALLPLMNETMAVIVQALLDQIVQAITTLQPVTILIPEFVTKLDPAFRFAVGIPVDIGFASKNDMTIHIPGGWYLARIAWEAKGRFGLIWGAVVHSLIAIAFWHLTTIMPPARFMQTALQDGQVMVVERIQSQVREFAEDIGAVEAKEFVTPEETEIEVNMPYLTIHPTRSQDVVARIKGNVYHAMNRIDVTQNAILKLKGPMLLSCGDQLFTNAIGVNTALLQPRFLMEMRISSFLIYFVSYHWRIMQLAFESQKCNVAINFMESLELQGEDYFSAVCRWTQHSLDLLDTTLLAMSIRPSLEGAAFARLIKTMKAELTEKMQIAQKARNDVCTGWPQEMITRLHEGRGCENESSAWKRSFAMWSTLYVDGIVTKPYRLAQLALAQLNLYEKRTCKGVTASLLGLMAPTALLFYGLFKPWIDAVSWARRKLSPRVKKPTMGLMTQLGLDEPPKVDRPRVSLLRRRSEATMTFMSSGSGNLHQHENIHHTSLSPSGLHTLATQHEGSLPGVSKQPSLIHNTLLKLNLDKGPKEYHDEFWYVVRLAVGATIILSLALLIENWRRLSFSAKVAPSHSFVDLPDLVGTKVAPWGCLGFLTTVSMTGQATLKRAFLRSCGVLLGSLSALVALSINARSGVFHAVWLMVFSFIAVWIGAHPQTPAIGFHPSWGYAAQLFTYQQTLLIAEVRMTSNSTGELILARLVGQATGIGLALVITWLLMPARANRSIKRHLASALWCLTEAFAAVAEMVLADGGDTLETQERMAALRRQWGLYQVSQYKRARRHIMRARQIENENEILKEAPAALQTSAVLSQAVGCTDRLLAYVEGVRAYTQREHRGSTQRGLKPDQGTEDLQVERKFKRILSEVINDLTATATLLRLVLTYGGKPWRARCAGIAVPENFNRETFLATLEVSTAGALGRLQEMASTLSKTPITVGFEGDDELSPPERLFVDRRSILWTFAGMFLSELNWLGGQIALLVRSGNTEDKN